MTQWAVKISLGRFREADMTQWGVRGTLRRIFGGGCEAVGCVSGGFEGVDVTQWGVRGSGVLDVAERTRNLETIKARASVSSHLGGREGWLGDLHEPVASFP